GLVKQAGASQASQKESVARSDDPVPRRIIDKSTLAISEAKRIRCKEHLRYVASQPCVICGRSPSHAHHVKYAQRRGLGIKVSDEFAVPLCATHHHQLHNTTKEREWWQERKIDPLMIAGTLWRESQKRGLIQLKPLPKNRFITCLIHQRHRQNRARRDRTRDLNSYGSSGIIAPPLVANVLTVVPVCCFTMINQREKRAEEGRLTHIWLIVIVFFLMLYGLYTWGIYPFKR